MLKPLLSRWRSDPTVGGNIVDWHTIPARNARLAPLPELMHPALQRALAQRGIRDLYLHQRLAWNHAQDGENVVVVTGTASGKTLCYNLPVLDTLLRDPKARALYLFPTKALAQDQLAGVNALLDAASPGDRPAVGAYDGDTPTHTRSAIRQNARLIISNPDMLHTGILPHHTSWADFFAGLKFVILDEMHIYRGVFGSHVANVIRRLKRIAQRYGARPQFIVTSATIANPVKLAGWLIEEPVTLIDEDGSARGEKHFLIYNPPVIDKELGIRRSSLLESVRLAEDLHGYHIQTILFGKTRRSVEVMLRYLRERIAGKNWDDLLAGEETAPNVRGYRSGYLPRQRREIERGLRQGEVRTVVATSALELGIDIGGMDASLLAGYPGTIAATWQQAGRAGRGQESSLTLLVVSANPLDQFLAKHPQYFFDRSPEQGLINPNNLLILLGHLRCAAFELPFSDGEAFGTLPADQAGEFLDFLASEGMLHHSAGRYFWMADKYPAEGVSLRSASADAVVLQAHTGDGITTIGKVDVPSATWMVHPGAVYMHEARTYFVESLDLQEKIAVLKPAELDYYTEDRSEKTVNLIQKLGEAVEPGCTKAYGEVQVVSQVVGFRKVRWHTNETLGFGELQMPPIELMTTGYWFGLDEATVQKLQDEGLWRNSPNDYGPRWPQIRDQVRARDGYRCQVCSTPEMGRAHDVHHKIPFRSFTNAAEANQLANLITLCPKCHHQVELNVRIRSGLGGLSFVLLNLAPLFLMCDGRDLGVHSDAQLSLVDGKPGVVLYDQAPGGIGFSEKLFEMHGELMQQARDLISTCECTDGCPSCVGPGGENGLGGKQETLGLVEALCG